MKLSFLILFFLVLSGISASQELRPDKDKDAPKELKGTAENQAKPTSPTAFEKSLIETLRTIADQQRTAYEQNDANQKSWDSPSVLVQAGLVVVGTLYTVFACLQWLVIRDNVRTTERAWVGFAFDQVFRLHDTVYDLKFINTGKTPGHIKEATLSDFEVEDRAKPFTPKQITKNKLGTLWTIFPGQAPQTRCVIKLDPKDIQQISDGAKRLVIHGFVLYDDVFGIRHVTNFYRVFASTADVQGIFVVPPDAQPGQNEAT